MEMEWSWRSWPMGADKIMKLEAQTLGRKPG